MRSLLAFLLVAWTTVVAPGLCAGGVLVHPCECPAGAECSHEESCSLDPCRDAVSTAREQSSSFPLPADGQAFLPGQAPAAIASLGATLDAAMGTVPPGAFAPLATRMSLPLLI